MKLGFVITNDKASYVAKEDSICLFSIAKEVALNKQWIKPCVPLQKHSLDSPRIALVETKAKVSPNQIFATQNRQKNCQSPP